MSVTVAQSAGTVVPTGTVSILDGTITLTTQPLVAGAISFSTALTTGTHALTASYWGDANYAPILSPVSIVVIGTPQVISFTPGVLSTFAGTGTAGETGNGGPAALAALNGPVRSIFDNSGNLYIADTGNNVVRKITPTGTISLFAGTGSANHTGDNGRAMLAAINAPRDVAIDSLGNIYILEAGTNDIRRVDTTGVITTCAGVPSTTANPTSGDGGAATAAYLNSPRAIAIDSSNNLYIAEYNGQVIRKVTTAGIISTIAGTAGVAGSTGDGGAAKAALIGGPYTLAFDAGGNLYLAEVGSNKIRKISTSGIITLAAGTGATGYAGDGSAAIAASMGSPRGLAIDAGGTIYLGDTGNFVVRKIDPSGIITTIAGSHSMGNSGDGGSAIAGTFNQIYGMAVDKSNNVYLDDQSANVIRKITVTSGMLVFPAQIPSTTSSISLATIYNSGGLPLTLSGITIATSGNSTAFAIVPSGGPDCTATTILAPGGHCLVGVTFTPTTLGQYAGTITVTDDTAGVSGSQQTISLTGVGALVPTVTLTATPSSVPVGASTLLSVTVTNTAYPAAGTPAGTVDIMNGTTLLYTLPLISGSATYTATLPRGSYTLTAAYSGSTTFSPATSSAVPFSVVGTNTTTTMSSALTSVAQGAGDLLTATISATSGSPTGTVTFSTTSGPLGTANVTGGVATLTAYFTSTGTQSIVATYSGDSVYNPSASTALTVTVIPGVVAVFTPGVVTTLAGTGAATSSGNGGLATSATINAPGGTVARDSSGNIYVPDTNGNQVRMVTPEGIISTIAGSLLGTTGYTGDGGPATSATLNAPRGIAIDSSGNIFILDSGNFVVRKINTNGIISTYAGTYSTLAPKDTGDGGPATSATINVPRGIAVDTSGNLYIAVNGGHAIRKVSTTGIITTVAGTGSAGYTGNGGGANVARLNTPNGVAVDLEGNLYIADTGNTVVRKVTASTGIISLVAGTNVAGYSGDGGLAVSAKLSGPRTIAVDASGSVYIGDTANNVIRKVTTDGYISTVAGTGVSGYFGDHGSATLAQFGQPYGVVVDSDGTLYVTENATNIIRRITTAPGLVNFGNLPSNTTAKLTVALGNAGIQPLVVSGIVTTGNGFSVVAPSKRGCTSASTIVPGAECILTVTFAPSALGPSSGTITFTDNAGNPQQISLIGVGVKVPPVITLTSSPAKYAILGTAVSLSVKVSSPDFVTPATGAVQFLRDSTVLSTGTLDSTGSAALLLGSALAPGPYNFSVAYSGDTNYQAGTSATDVFGVQNDFSITLSSTSGQTSPGGTLTTTLTITPEGLAPAVYQLACANQPVYITCSFSPATITPSIVPMTSVLTITANPPKVGMAGIGIIAAASLLLLFLAGGGRKSTLQLLFAIFVLTGLGTASGCGSGSTLPTPAVVPVTVTVTSAQVPHEVVYNVNFY